MTMAPSGAIDPVETLSGSTISTRPETSPASAVAAVVAGEARYTRSSKVPERPLKLRLKVRTLALPVGGAWPMPTHGPQAGSRMRRPARSRSSSTPEVVMVVRIWRLPGEMVPTVAGGRWRPRMTAAGMARSSYQELTLEPKQTWYTGVPATCSTGTTLSGWDGLAISGSSAARSTWTCSSEGKIAVVPPSSVIMLQTVARWVTGRLATPGPVNSKMRPSPPLTVYLRMSHRIKSLEATQGGRRFSRWTPTTIGVGVWNGWPAMARATSRPPAPMASAPHAPEVGVWESAPSRVAPGRANRSVWTWWQMPLPARE